MTNRYLFSPWALRCPLLRSALESVFPLTDIHCSEKSSKVLFPLRLQINCHFAWFTPLTKLLLVHLVDKIVFRNNLLILSRQIDFIINSILSRYWKPTVKKVLIVLLFVDNDLFQLFSGNKCSNNPAKKKNVEYSFFSSFLCVKFWCCFWFVLIDRLTYWFLRLKLRLSRLPTNGISFATSLFQFVHKVNIFKVCYKRPQIWILNKNDLICMNS